MMALLVSPLPQGSGTNCRHASPGLWPNTFAGAFRRAPLLRVPESCAVALVVGVALGARDRKWQQGASRRRQVCCRSSGSVEPSEVAAGAQLWRKLPAEIPDNLEKMLRSAQNDIVREELDPTPFRRLAVIRVPIDSMPCVGQLKQVALTIGDADSGQYASVLHSREHHGGFIGCVVAVTSKETKVTLPRGGIGAEILDIACPDESHMLLTLRGVSALRIIDRVAQPGDNGALQPLVQEVLEWGQFEESEGGEVAILKELSALEALFKECGDLQNRTGIWAAGDLYSKSLPELTKEVAEVLKGQELLGLELNDETKRRAVFAANAVISAFGDPKRSTFLCDPTTLLHRLRLLTKFLQVMDDLLRSRLRK
ncbi:unnamed protein product [Polarella glacialis]|uniref:Lon N-terminal domain-containing protein n=1 Tax=Polarella glacialis TaxID=89957 RepID=A0A813JYD9_POLGL|nr:unnamed protein product [Polarella glacialis]